MENFNMSGGSGSGIFGAMGEGHSSRISAIMNRSRTGAELTGLEQSSQSSTQQMDHDDQFNMTAGSHHEITVMELDPLTNSLVESRGIMFYTDGDERPHILEQANLSAGRDPPLNLKFRSTNDDPLASPGRKLVGTGDFIEFVPGQNPYEVLLRKARQLKNPKSTKTSANNYGCNMGDSQLSNHQNTLELIEEPLYTSSFENNTTDFENSQASACNSQISIRESDFEGTPQRVSVIKHGHNSSGGLYVTSSEPVDVTSSEPEPLSENCGTAPFTFQMPMAIEAPKSHRYEEGTRHVEHKFIVPALQPNKIVQKVIRDSAHKPLTHAQPQNDILPPFLCDLCDERFHKKLLLNNHVERRHGIKFVFTQKGQKVKLVRMPEIFHEGEKLDPCVQLLMEASDKKQSKNIIGVQAMDNPDQQVLYQSDVHQEINTQELLKTKNGQGMGILVANITFPAIKVASDNDETPFAVFSPYNSEKLYLFNILQMNATRQMLLPATLDDLEKSNGHTKEEITYFTSNKSDDPASSTQDRLNEKTPSPLGDNCIEVNEEGNELIFPKSTEGTGPGPSSSLVKKTRRIFTHVAVVAILKQVLDKDSGKCKLEIEPSASHKIEKVELCHPKSFVRFGIQCKVKRLRCFSETTSLISPPPSPVKELPKPKRKYVRKILPGAPEEKSTEELVHQVGGNETKKNNFGSKIRKLESEGWDSDNQNNDATYKPHLTIPKSIKRKRGRPKKLIFEDETTVLAADKSASEVEQTQTQQEVGDKEATQTHVVPNIVKNKTFVPRLRGPKCTIKKQRKTALDSSELTLEDQQLVKAGPDTDNETKGIEVDGSDLIVENITVLKESAFNENKDIVFEKEIVKKGKASFSEIESAFQDFTFSPFQEPEIKGEKIKTRAQVERNVNKMNEPLRNIANLQNIVNKISVVINRRQGSRLRRQVMT